MKGEVVITLEPWMQWTDGSIHADCPLYMNTNEMLSQVKKYNETSRQKLKYCGNICPYVWKSTIYLYRNVWKLPVVKFAFKSALDHWTRNLEWKIDYSVFISQSEDHGTSDGWNKTKKIPSGKNGQNSQAYWLYATLFTSLLVFSVTRIDGIFQLSHTYLHIGTDNIGSRSYCSRVEINALTWQQEKPKLKPKIPTMVLICAKIADSPNSSSSLAACTLNNFRGTKTPFKVSTISLDRLQRKQNGLFYRWNYFLRLYLEVAAQPLLASVLVLNHPRKTVQNAQGIYIKKR